MAMITADPKDVPARRELRASTPEHLAKAKALIANYPPGRQASAVIGVLDLAQRQAGLAAARGDGRGRASCSIWRRSASTRSRPSTRCSSCKPKGKYQLQVCATTPCWLRGSDAHRCKACEHAADGETFTRAGGRVPRRLRERADRADQRRLLRRPRRGLAQEGARCLQRGETPKPGPQVDRQTSAPEGGADHLEERVGDACRQGPHLHQPLRLPRLAPDGRPRARRLGQHQGDPRRRRRTRSSRR